MGEREERAFALTAEFVAVGAVAAPHEGRAADGLVVPLVVVGQPECVAELVGDAPDEDGVVLAQGDPAVLPVAEHRPALVANPSPVAALVVGERARRHDLVHHEPAAGVAVEADRPRPEPVPLHLDPVEVLDGREDSVEPLAVPMVQPTVRPRASARIASTSASVVAQEHMKRQPPEPMKL